MKAQFLHAAGTAVLFSALMAASPSANAVVLTANGSICHSQSSGLIYTLTQTRNNNASNRTAYCQIPNSGLEGEYETIWLLLDNRSASPVTVTCYARTGHNFLFAGGDQVTIQTDVAANSKSIVVWDNATELDRYAPADSLSFACTLPQNVGIDSIFVQLPDPI